MQDNIQLIKKHECLQAVHLFGISDMQYYNLMSIYREGEMFEHSKRSRENSPWNCSAGTFIDKKG